MSSKPVKLFIAIPCYGGMVHGKCTLSLISLYDACMRRGVEVQMKIILNDSLITRARNLLVHWFLQTDCTHMLFIDADIEFRAEDIIKMIISNVGIIGGLYAKKELDWNEVSKCIKTGECTPNDLLVNAINPVLIRVSKDRVLDLQIPIEAMRVGTGIMLVKRDVFTMMKDKFKGETYDQQQERGIYCFFDCRLSGREFLSEDWFFCQRWIEMGGKVYAAPWTKTVHYGHLGYPVDLECVRSHNDKLTAT